jgi:hypothetical protein
MRNIILVPLLIFILFSCSPDKKSNEVQKDKLRLEALTKLSSQYGAVVGFDTLRFPLTIQYQNFLRQNNKVILDKFRIDDIKELDSIYIVSIEKGYASKLFIDLTCTKQEVQELLTSTFERTSRFSHTKDLYIVATITSIQKIKYRIDSDVEKDDQSPSVYLELDASDAFLCKGKLISVYKTSINDF